MIAYWRYPLQIESSKTSVKRLSNLEESHSCRVNSRSSRKSGLSSYFYKGYAVCSIVFLFNPFPVTGSAAAGRIIRLDRVESEEVSEKRCGLSTRQKGFTQENMTSDGSGTCINPLAISLWEAQNR